MNRNDTSMDHDRKMRTFGFHRAAQRTAANWTRRPASLLQAYCDGVNAYFREQRDNLHPLFARTGVAARAVDAGRLPGCPGGTWASSSPPTARAT